MSWHVLAALVRKALNSWQWPDTADFPSFFCQVSETKVKAKACMPQLSFLDHHLSLWFKTHQISSPASNPQGNGLERSQWSQWSFQIGTQHRATHNRESWPAQWHQLDWWCCLARRPTLPGLTGPRRMRLPRWRRSVRPWMALDAGCRPNLSAN